MKLNQEGVEKAAQAVCRQAGDDAAELGVFHHELATAALTAYFDHLKSEGLMRECCGVLRQRYDDKYQLKEVMDWEAGTIWQDIQHFDFKCAIIRTDKD